MYFTETTEPQPQPRPWATYRSWEPPRPQPSSWDLTSPWEPLLASTKIETQEEEPKGREGPKEASSWDLTSPWDPLLASTKIAAQEEGPKGTESPRRRTLSLGLTLRAPRAWVRKLLRRLWPRAGGEPTLRLKPHRIPKTRAAGRG